MDRRSKAAILVFSGIAAPICGAILLLRWSTLSPGFERGGVFLCCTLALVLGACVVAELQKPAEPKPPRTRRQWMILFLQFIVMSAVFRLIRFTTDRWGPYFYDTADLQDLHNKAMTLLFQVMVMAAFACWPAVMFYGAWIAMRGPRRRQGDV